LISLLETQQLMHPHLLKMRQKREAKCLVNYQNFSTVIL
jgi:hypothetical protein